MITLPSKSFLYRSVPLHKFYSKVQLPAALKAKAAEQIEKIVWMARLAPDTINVACGSTVEEIQVFHLLLRLPEPDVSVLKLIEEAIPYRIVFILEYQEQKRLFIHYKKDKVKGGSEVRCAFTSEWTRAEEAPKFTIQGLNMDAVYENFIRQLAGDRLKKDVPLLQAIEIMEQQEKLQNKIASLEKKMSKEKQPRRKRDYFQQISELKTHLL